MTTSVTTTPLALTPITVGATALQNRIVMAPMTRNRAIGNVPNAMMVEYYRQRASAGLIITEGTAPSADGTGYARIPGLHTSEQRDGWKQVTDAVHAEGGRIFLQIMHTGRIFNTLNTPGGIAGVAPSAIAAAGDIWTDQQQLQPHDTPEALDADGLARVQQAFVDSAKLAIDAGFDGIELHAANGYLLQQFLNPHSNQRTDAYGGSVEGRARFVLETARAVARVIGADRTAIRLSPWNQYNDQPDYDEIDATYVLLARELQALGIAYLHLIDPAGYGAHGVATRAAVREHFRGTIILNGGIRTLYTMQDLLASGTADLVAVGAPFISNPDLVDRLRQGLPLSQGNPATFFAPGASGFAEGYTDYPAAEIIS
ncbi:MAG TPA: alkene reductase [Gemmatimonas aurantiaca]|uniref:Alkene reductase n=2 Tax=Gemmatimonas aurantiaca TaxID=173480 RepID=A0A3D4V6L3_9BACT|nr:alkene reductase [Gemmatimonas aurantiaca]BAH40583.1 putative oxidoreductase [Gemmatimonas aurantiaca T-27]HCT56392.1 alkene reductase [Gemmatimonas aurantiaca]